MPGTPANAAEGSMNMSADPIDLTSSETVTQQIAHSSRQVARRARSVAQSAHSTPPPMGAVAALGGWARAWLSKGWRQGGPGLATSFMRGFWVPLLLNARIREMRGAAGIPATHAPLALPVAPPADVTALILTFNEELHIARCIARIAPFVTRVVVIDSFSTDATTRIAAELGAQVLQHPFTSHASQFNWGLDHAGITTGWTLRLDADEYMDPDALEEMRRIVATAPAEVAAAAFSRGVVFQGHRIRHGGIGEVLLTRLWRTGQARIEARWMDEHVVVSGGETIVADRGAIVDEGLKDLGWFTTKHNDYATRQVIQYLLTERGEAERVEEGLNAHVHAKRALRDRLYVPAPLFLRALLYFIYRYGWKRGFRDGPRGFAFHGLQGLWNFMLVDLKLYEARRIIARDGWEAFTAWVLQDTGIDLTRPLS